MKTIWKKILPWYFEAVRNGSKTFEIRKDEDGFEVGDHILLCEWSGTAYTGFTLEAEITYILRDAEQYGLMPGFCILGIKALDGKDTNVHTNSALDHIHNVVSEREYQRGYKQAKEKYDHKLTEIKSRFKDRYYNKGYSEGYEQGKADAEKELHDKFMRAIPEPWK